MTRLTRDPLSVLTLLVAALVLLPIGGATLSVAQDKGAGNNRAQFDKALEALKALAAKSPSNCPRAMYIAASDKEVQDLFFAKLKEYVFKGITCLESPAGSANLLVLFDFDCKPGILCLIDPNFLVVVDVPNGKVVEILDPYIGGGGSRGRHGTNRAPVDLSMDIELKDVRREGDRVCATPRVCVTAKVRGRVVGEGCIDLPEACVYIDGDCVGVSAEAGDVKAEAEVCIEGTEICAKVRGCVKVFGSWKCIEEKECVGFSRDEK
jgi:hypothetical protein